mmetsp:Transcript_25512/g.43019  ORF Transcript_25512/g.43019 Transcript_25512/m.43019 type:complete len:298 (-) Transcript_25512:1030-1923(-)|eukprot:CAMPEP_0114414996 /NCGR_PEP_ID=MMETSP0103-20121206/1682_1 /TAXON_ID=37642 ORGANISM="Paraphysomonas imperforata, Strain PA2" /NCGR_SAMPLE_ID=MMETSP0103 /ASSEMBLY_ACC=CAM_ASM_000201 /LENGTH=297 /DNA_ID=CAMNT_0001583167 /DNA_START=137 /DNA_END=1030 /DNA_ORIENTATION=-
MNHTRSALELDGSSAVVDIDQFNDEIVRLRKLSIALIEQELSDLQYSVDQGVEDVMLQLNNEKMLLKQDIAEERERIKATAIDNINHLKNKYRRQSETLVQQKELLTVQHDDQEVEEIITLLSSNLRTIKNKIETQTSELSASLKETEDRYSAVEARIESRAAESRVAIKEDVMRQVSHLRTRLAQEEKLLSVEEACRLGHLSSTQAQPLTSSSPRRNGSLTPILPSLSEEGELDDDTDTASVSPIVASRLQFTTGTNTPRAFREKNDGALGEGDDETKDHTEGGYSESDSDSDSDP